MSADRNRASLAGSRIGVGGGAGAGGTQLPRRAPSPSSAAFASTTGGGGGASRIPAPPASSSAAATAASSTSRFGVGGASRIGGGLAAAARAAGPSAALAAKRTSAAAGLSSDGGGAVKRQLSAAPSAGCGATTSTIPRRPASRASVASNAGSDTMSSSNGPTAPAPAPAPIPPHLLSGPPSESAEYLLSQMKNEYERRLLQREQEYAALQRELGESVRAVSKAERRANEIAEEWGRERAAVALREEEASLVREGLSADLDEARRLYSSLALAHERLQADSSEGSARMHAELSELRLGRATMESEVARLGAELGRAVERAEQAELERGALEKVLEEEGAKGLEREAKLREVATGWGSREEAEAVEKEIKRQAIHIRELEETIAKLKAENKYHAETMTNVELLREEKRSLESKLRAMDELRQTLAAAEAKAQAAEEEIAAWTQSVGSEITSGPDAHLVSQLLDSGTLSLPTPPPTPLSPSSIQAYLHQSLAVQSALLARVDAASQTVADLQARLVEAEEARADHGRERDAVGRELAEEKARSARALAAEERLKGEVARCKAILDSYEAEHQTFKQRETSVGFSEAEAARIKSLEALVEEQRQQCDALGSQLEAVQKELAAAREALSLAAADAGAAQKVKELSTALETAKEEYNQLFKDAEQLSLENDRLLIRVGRGEFDTSKEKCWTLTDNPANRHFAVRTATLDALKKENEDLLKRLDELNAELSKAVAAASAGKAAEGEGDEAAAAAPAEGTKDDAAAAALVPRQVVENYKKEIQDLQVSIKQKDKSMLRLKQVFTAKATEFREVVQSLFGYKIRFLENGKVKLSSVYALSSKGRGTNIIFQSNSDNTAKMQLLLGDDDDGEGGPLRDLQWLREYWLGEERQNVPCFLAALSKELYEAVTRVEKRGAWRLESGEDAVAADEDAEMQQA